MKQQQGLSARALRAGYWCGSIYRLNRDWFGMKIKGYPPIAISFEHMIRLLHGDTVEDKGHEIAAAPLAPIE